MIGRDGSDDSYPAGPRLRDAGNKGFCVSSLDILTELGQKSVADEREAARIWERHFPLPYISTPKDRPAWVDAVILRRGEILYAVETKCRYDMDLKRFTEERNSEWLITAEKIDKAKIVCEALCVPLLGFLYLVPDKCLLVDKILDEKGNIVIGIKYQDTATQKTINGGTIVRRNAFINMLEAKILF
jgi:hypothetical protein